jgi:hypothetical protein
VKIHEQILFPEDIRKETGFGMCFIYRQLNTGKIPGAVRVGDRWILSRENFNKWINGETKQ